MKSTSIEIDLDAAELMVITSRADFHVPIRNLFEITLIPLNIPPLAYVLVIILFLLLQTYVHIHLV